MAGNITQCPQCQTSFRVTDVQLSIADGAVRCGSCLHIFNAAEHWIDSETNSTPPDTHSTDTNIEALDQATEIQATLNDELVFSDTQEKVATEQLFNGSNNEEEGDDQAEEDPLFSDEKGLAEALANDELINDTVEISAIMEEEIILDDEDTTDNTGFSESFLDLDDWDDEPDNVFKDLDELSGEFDSDDEAWAKELLDDASEQPASNPYDEILAQPPTTTEPVTDSTDSNNTRDPDAGLANTPPDDESKTHSESNEEFPELPELFDDEEDLDSGLLNILGEANTHADDTDNYYGEDDEFILDNEPLMAGERIADDKEALLANIEPEPVQMHSHKKITSWKDWGMRAAVVLAIVFLGLQYISANFDQLSRDNRYRPFFAQACSVLSCSLPALYDVSRIHSSNLIVRTHPTSNSALIIDAIITNRAIFKQPFPIMELTFTNMEGEVIAGRQFKPQEYLGGEMLGSKTMPAKQPIHIALEIIDPGKEAINYQLSFYPNDKS